MLKITLITWGGAQCAIVHTTNGLAPFLARISKVADARVRQTYPLNAVKDQSLREGWAKAALAHGACWALGLTAVSF